MIPVSNALTPLAFRKSPIITFTETFGERSNAMKVTEGEMPKWLFRLLILTL